MNSKPKMEIRFANFPGVKYRVNGVDIDRKRFVEITKTTCSIK